VKISFLADILLCFHQHLYKVSMAR